MHEFMRGGLARDPPLHADFVSVSRYRPLMIERQIIIRKGPRYSSQSIISAFMGKGPLADNATE